MRDNSTAGCIKGVEKVSQGSSAEVAQDHVSVASTLRAGRTGMLAIERPRRPKKHFLPTEIVALPISLSWLGSSLSHSILDARLGMPMLTNYNRASPCTTFKCASARTHARGFACIFIRPIAMSDKASLLPAWALHMMSVRV